MFQVIAEEAHSHKYSTVSEILILAYFEMKKNLIEPPQLSNLTVVS